MPKVLISDELSETAVNIFKERGVEVAYEPKLGKDKAKLEQVIGLYESRREALLNAIKSTDIKTTWFGRAFGYGDLTVFALMGEVRFAHIANPDQVKALIDHLQKRSSQRIQREDCKV